MAKRFVNCRIDFIFRNIFDPLSQLIQMILVPSEQPRAFFASWRIAENPRGTYSHTVLLAQRSAQKALNGQSLFNREVFYVVNHYKLTVTYLVPDDRSSAHGWLLYP